MNIYKNYKKLKLLEINKKFVWTIFGQLSEMRNNAGDPEVNSYKFPKKKECALYQCGA